MNLPAHEDREAASPRPGSATIVIGCYNHARFVEQCLDSAFAQTHEDLRVIVFDDASTDDSQQVIRKYLARTGHDDATFIAHEKNRGLCASLNEVRELVDTEFVAFISADDWMLPERFAVQIRELESYGPTYAGIYGDCLTAGESGETTGSTYYEDYSARFSPGYVPPHGDIYLQELTEPANATPALLFRTAAQASVGLYDEQLGAEDTDMLLRIARDWLVAYSPHPLVVKRGVEGSMLGTLYADIVKLTADQRRMYRKHLGTRPEVNAIVVTKLGTFAKAGYLAGADPSSVAADLALVAQATPSVPNWFYAQASKLGVPGRWLNGGVVVARKLKLRVRSLRKRDD